MATRVSKEKITREPGYLYYLGKDGYVWANPMRSNSKGRKHKVGTEHIVRQPGLYFVDKAGYVSYIPRGARAGKKKRMMLPLNMKSGKVSLKKTGAHVKVVSPRGAGPNTGRAAFNRAKQRR